MDPLQESEGRIDWRQMVKRVFIALAVVAILGIGTAAAVFAQTPTPQGQFGWGCPMWGWGWGGNGNTTGAASNPTIQRLADKIGISASDLAQQLQSGKSVMDVNNGKVSEQDLVTVLIQPQVDALNLRVKYGYLTQDQANSMQQYMADRAKYQLEQKGFYFGAGGFGGPGYGPGMMGRGFGGPGYGIRN